MSAELFALHCRAHNLKPVAEFKFCPTRRWRADFCFPDQKLLIEVEGAGWVNGRHNRGAGFAADLLKYEAAQRLGYTVYRCSPAMIKNGSAIETTMLLLAMAGDKEAK